MKRTRSHFLKGIFFTGLACLAGGAAVEMCEHGEQVSSILCLIIAALLVVIGIYDLSRFLFVKTHEHVLREKFPTQPWFWRSDWVKGQVKGGAAVESHAHVIFFVIWTAFTAGMAVSGVLPDATDDSSEWWLAIPFRVFISLFPLGGIWFLSAFIREAGKQRRFGKTRLHLETIPIPIGGILKGVIQKSAAPNEDVQLSLECVNCELADGSIGETVVWRDTYSTRVEPDGSIPVQFHLPLNLPETFRNERSNEGTLWRVDVTSSTDGFTTLERYIVPVFNVRISRDRRAISYR